MCLQMLSYGCTRLEIGLQSIFEDVARDTNRGHTVAAVGECFHLAKNAGFKVIAHMMPDLPNMGWERDMESFREFFENPDFRTDGLKVACSVCCVLKQPGALYCLIDTHFACVLALELQPVMLHTVPSTRVPAQPLSQLAASKPLLVARVLAYFESSVLTSCCMLQLVLMSSGQHGVVRAGRAHAAEDG